MDVVEASNAAPLPSEPVKFRGIPIPQHRYTQLKKFWTEIYAPIYEEMKIDIHMNLKPLQVELNTRSNTPDARNLHKCEDMVHAFTLGFELRDVVAMLRVENLSVESFEITDVKMLKGEHLSKAIGRLSGKTKIAIENATRTRIVIDSTTIHILGSLPNIKIAKDSLSTFILGSPNRINWCIFLDYVFFTNVMNLFPFSLRIGRVVKLFMEMIFQRRN
ncbi:hypothetical protein ACJIZ3_002523 [Penstemon smallii]|uniref:PNO1 second type I KH domain-containing protein n=1 Tax=Penstemon smallii TaxID=265156 RepID=A0ABD3U716_9LAMI